MTKFLSRFIGITLCLGAVGLCGCSLYSSQGRKNLEGNARTDSGKNFITADWQCEQLSPPQTEAITPTEDIYWTENGHLFRLNAFELCYSTRPLTGSELTH